VRSISFSMTERQLLDCSKTVTRRTGWHGLRPGDQLRAVRKAMGLKRGEKQHVLGLVYVVSVRRERLDAITPEDVAAEGYPELDAAAFVAKFCKAMGAKPSDLVTRIKFRFSPEVKP
jgi:hypothetical protein